MVTEAMNEGDDRFRRPIGLHVLKKRIGKSQSIRHKRRMMIQTTLLEIRY